MQFRESAAVFHGGALDGVCRNDFSALFEELQVSARTDLHAVLRNDKAGSSDAMVLEQKNYSIAGLHARKADHRFLRRELSEIRFVSNEALLQVVRLVVQKSFRADNLFSVVLNPVTDTCAGWSLTAREFVSYHVDNPNWPTGRT